MFEPSEHLWRVWGLILNVILHLLPSCWGFSFAFGRGVSFFGGIQHSPFDGCSAASCILEFSEKLSTCMKMLYWLIAHRIKSKFLLDLTKPLNGQRSLVGYSPWGQKESDMTE